MQDPFASWAVITASSKKELEKACRKGDLTGIVERECPVKLILGDRVLYFKQGLTFPAIREILEMGNDDDKL